MKILESYFFLKTIVYINQIEIAISISMSLGFDFSFKTSLLYCMCDLFGSEEDYQDRIWEFGGFFEGLRT